MSLYMLQRNTKNHQRKLLANHWKSATHKKQVSKRGEGKVVLRDGFIQDERICVNLLLNVKLVYFGVLLHSKEEKRRNQNTTSPARH